MMKEELTFKDAEQLVEHRKSYRNFKQLEREIFKQYKRAVEPKDLMGVDCCYLLASAQGKKTIENLNSYLTVEDARKIVRLWPQLGGEEWKAIVKKEIPALYKVYKSWLNNLALYTFIEYRAGEDLR